MACLGNSSEFQEENISLCAQDVALNHPASPRNLFDVNYPLAVIYVTITSVVSVTGVVGNSFILYVTKKEKNMNQTGKMFVINMALADLCVSAIANPMCIVGAVLGKDLENIFFLCEMIASICLTACICVFLNITYLTINRYVFICKNALYHKIYTNVRTIIMCLSSWLLAFLLEIPNFLGWGGHSFDEKSHQCIWDRTASRSYTLFVSLGLISSPLLCMGVCHVLIFNRIWATKQNVLKFDKDTYNSYTAFEKAIRSSKLLLAMFIVFLICWTPYTIVIAVDHMDVFAMETHLFVTLIAHGHSCVNFFVYMKFKRSFRTQFLGLFPRSTKVAPLDRTPSAQGSKTNVTLLASGLLASQTNSNSKTPYLAST